MDNESVATLERPADAGPPPRGIVSRWCKEIELADRVEEPWRKNGKEVLKRFRDEGLLEKGAVKRRALGSKFNILRPNTRVMKAAIYQEPPKPDVRRRFKDKDPLGKAVSEVTERGLAYCMDKYGLDEKLQLAINDMLLPGRGVTRMRYEPEFVQVQGPDGKPQEQIAWEKVCPKHVNWEDYRRGPGRTWDEVPWQAFRHRLTREEADKELPEAKALLKDIEFDTTLDMTDEDQRAVKDNPSLKDVFKRLTVWEVWDKTRREVLFIAPSYKEKPLVVRPDPLGLEDFFDTPRPLYAVEESDTLIPLEDYRAYQDQAKELDNITGRINAIVKGLKVRGLYNSAIKVMGDVMSAEDNTLIPATEISELFNNGGLDKNIWLMPIEKIAQILQYLYQHREETKQVIYEITGLSDIMRGSTKASETATAQSIKAQNGAISIQDRRKGVKRYARDLVRIAAEILCEHFQVETLKQMTGLDYPTEDEKKQIGAQLAMLKQAIAAAPAPMEGQPAPPPPVPPEQLEQMQDRLKMPSWEQILQVMRDDKLRCYRIDVETDETAFGDQAAEQQAVTELLQGVTAFLTGMAPLVQTGVVTPEIAKSMLMLAVRRFKAGREIEDALEELGDNPIPPPPDPNAGKIEAEKESNAQKLQFEREKHEQDMAFQREEHQFAQQQHADQQMMQREQHADDMAMRERERADAQMNATEERTSREKIATAKKPSTVLIDKEGKASDIAEGTAGVAAAVQQMTETLAQLLQMNAQAEQRQAQAIGQMGQQIGQALLAGLTAPKEVKRDSKGKIRGVVVTPMTASETRM